MRSFIAICNEGVLLSSSIYFVSLRYIVWRFVILQMGEYICSLVWFLFQYFFLFYSFFLFYGFLFHLFQLLRFREKTNQHKPLYRIQYKQQQNLFFSFNDRENERMNKNFWLNYTVYFLTLFVQADWDLLTSIWFNW